MARLPASIRARLRAVRLLQPLERRDFALLTAGSLVSLLGDGFFSIALAWQVYEISNVPTALSIVGVAWTVPLIVFLLLGGVFTDRYDRRRLMIGADIVRAAGDRHARPPLAGRGDRALARRGAHRLRRARRRVLQPGIHRDRARPPARRAPAAGQRAAGARSAADHPPRRPGRRRLRRRPAGRRAPPSSSTRPASWSRRSRSPPSAVRPARQLVSHGVRQALAEVGEGLAFARRTPWLLGDARVGDVQPAVLHRPGRRCSCRSSSRTGSTSGRRRSGAIFAVGGVGSIVSAIAIGQLGLPRRYVTVMYACWALGVALLAGYGLMTSLWHGMLIGLVTARCSRSARSSG